MISDAMPADEVAGRIKRFNLLKYEWIGLCVACGDDCGPRMNPAMRATCSPGQKGHG